MHRLGHPGVLVQLPLSNSLELLGMRTRRPSATKFPFLQSKLMSLRTALSWSVRCMTGSMGNRAHANNLTLALKPKLRLEVKGVIYSGSGEQGISLRSKL